MATPHNQPAPLVVRHLTLNRGQTPVLANLDFTVHSGEVLGLVGLNGAGKSTTLHCLAGQLAPTAGDILIAGVDMADEPTRARQHIGYLPDPPALHDELRVQFHLSAMASLYGLARPTRKAAVERVLHQCSLTTVADKRIAHLSQGYRQRVGLAQALLHNPALLLLDEPTNGLDIDQQRHFAEIVRTVAAHCAVVISSHHMSDLHACCTRMASLRGGTLTEMTDINATPRPHTDTTAHADTVFIRVRQSLDSAELVTLPGVMSAEPERDGWMLRYRGDTAQLSQSIAERGWGLRQLSPRLLESTVTTPAPSPTPAAELTP